MMFGMARDGNATYHTVHTGRGAYGTQKLFLQTSALCRCRVASYYCAVHLILTVFSNIVQSV